MDMLSVLAREQKSKGPLSVFQHWRRKGHTHTTRMGNDDDLRPEHNANALHTQLVLESSRGPVWG